MNASRKRKVLSAAVLLLVLALPAYLLAAHAITRYRLSHTTLTAQECPVHHLLLRRTWVPVEYGDMTNWNAYCEARDPSFPYAHSVWFGGCTVGSEGAAHEVLYCPQCRVAEKQWEAVHWPK